MISIFFGVNLFSQNDTIYPSLISAGGKYHINHYTSEQGLKGVVTEHVFQDSKGYIWISTRSGLNKLNGFEVETFTEKEGLVNNQPKWVTEDSEGLIWVATERGVSSYDGRSFTNYTMENGLKYDQTWCLLEHKDGGMLVGTSNGVDLIRNGIPEHYMDFDTVNLAKNWVRSLNYDSKGNLWVGVGAFYVKVSEDGSREEIVKSGPPIAWEETADGSIWMSGWSGNLYRYLDGHTTVYPLYTPIQEIAVDEDGFLWMASWEEGLLKFDQDTTIYKFGTKEGLSNNSLWHVMIDAEGCIWSASYGGGANQLVTERFSVISVMEGLSDNIVNDVAIDSFGNIWAATDGGISKVLPDGSIRIYNESDGLVNGKAQSIMVDKNNHVWSVLYAGGKSRIEFLPDGSVNFYGGGGFDIAEDSRGFQWMCTDGGGTCRFDLKNKKSRYFRPKSIPTKPRSFRTYEDKDTNIWIGIDHNGFHVYDYKTDTYIEDVIPEYIRHEEGNEIGQDSHGNFWMTLGRRGIYHGAYENEKITFLDSITMDDGLLENAIAGILIEGDVMWVNTMGGLSKLDLGEYYQTGTFKFQNYDKRKGYLGEGFSGLVRKGEDELIMGTSKGILIFHESKDKDIKAPPFTNITSVKLSKQDVDWRSKKVKMKANSVVPSELSLTHEENHLTFSFIGVSFSAPEEVRYKYMLEGFDDDWSPETDQREIAYSNIPPGEYTFKVKSVNLDGVWDETPDSIKIVISPPFWQTWWFRTLMIFALALLIFVVFQLRLRKLQRDKKILEDKVEQRTEQLQVAYDQIEEKNHEITDSIAYAKRIQSAILPPASYFKEKMMDSFVLYKPKDIVAGDFYWLNEWENEVLFAVGDCTGHGVPGAMVSVVCHGALNRSVREFDLHKPSDILDQTREIVIETFEKSEEEVKDGMDIALCSLDREKGIINYSGANNNLYLLRNGEIIETKADKQPIGKYDFAQPFTNHEIKVEKGDCIYLFSDGFADQFGGEKGKKLKYKPFKQMIVNIHQKPMEEQHNILLEEFEKWRGEFEQIDDVCIIGIRI